MLSLEALVELVHALRAKGYDVGTQECLTASRLVLALHARGELPAEPERLASVLAPVFCSSRVEQEAFHRDFVTWAKQRAAVAERGARTTAETAETVVPDTGRKDDTRPEPRVDPPAPRWWTRARLAGAALALAAVLLAAWQLPGWLPQQARITVVAPPAASVELGSGCLSCRIERQGDGSYTLAYRRRDLPLDVQATGAGLCPASAPIEAGTAQPVQLKITLQAEPCAGVQPVAGPARRSTVLPTVTGRQQATLPRVPDRAWQAVAAAVPALVGVVALVLLGWRTRLALSSAERAQPPDLKNLRLASGGFVLFDRATLRRIAQEFRRHRPRPSTEIDAPATVAASIARGGLFTPVLQQRKALPEYLVLIDQAGARDHQARWAQELVAQLAQGGVVVDRYFYNRDPRHVQTAFDRPGHIRAADLLARHHDHVLMVFGDGEGFFDPLSHEPQPWLQAFAAWERRVLVTPLPQHRWGWREAALRNLGFVIAPSDLGGLQLVASMAEVFRPPGTTPRRFPPLLATGDGRWLERGAPEAAELDRLAGQLKWFLGPPGYQWLCALALYPQLQWDITQHLGLRLLADEQKVRTLLAELIQLPWLRQGQMPQWLRLRLVADLSPASEALARQAYAELLGSAGAAEGFLLQVASDDAALTRGARLRAAVQRWRQHAHGQDAARRSHPDSPLRDYAFVSFMRGDRPGQLEMEAPASWSRLFERGWLPEARHAAVAAVAAAVLGAGTWWLAGLGFKRPLEIVALHAQPGSGLFIRAVGQPSLWLDADSAQAVVGSTAQLSREPTALAQLWAGASGQAVLATTPDGQWTALADANGDISVRPTAAGTGAVRGGHTAGGAVDPRVFALSADGRRLLYARPGGTLTLVSWPASGGVNVWPAPEGRSRSVFAVGPMHVALASADRQDFDVYALNGESGFPRLEQPPGTVTALAFSPDGQRLAAAYEGGGLWQWSLAQPRRGPKAVGVPASPVRRLSYSADGTLLAMGSDDGSVQLLDPATQETLPLPSDGPPSPIVQLALQSDRLRVAAADAQGRLVAWSLSPPQRAGTPQPEPTAPGRDELARAAVEVRYCAPAQQEAAVRLVQALREKKLVASAGGVYAPRDRDRLADRKGAVSEIRHAPAAGPAAALLANELRGLGRFDLSPDPSLAADAFTVLLCDPRTGATPEQVRDAQRALQQLYGGSGPADGVLGPATIAAVQRFQQERKLPVTGELDAATRDALAKAAAAAPAPVTGWCCRRAPANPVAQQALPQGGVTQATAEQCTQQGGRFAATQDAANRLCEATNAVRLLGLRAGDGSTLRLSTGSDQPPVPLVAEVDVDLAESAATLELTVQLPGPAGGCRGGGRVVAQTALNLSSGGRRSVTLRLTPPLPPEFGQQGYLGLGARLLPVGKERSSGVVLAGAEPSGAACQAYVMANGGDAACRAGYVLRGAYDGDPVCVTPATRQQAQADNAAAAERREPNGGAFGVNTCRPGWVWREAREGDVVCVTPEVRSQTAVDNRLAASRSARPQGESNDPAQDVKKR